MTFRATIQFLTHLYFIVEMNLVTLPDLQQHVDADQSNYTNSTEVAHKGGGAVYKGKGHCSGPEQPLVRSLQKVVPREICLLYVLVPIKFTT